MIELAKKLAEHLYGRFIIDAAYCDEDPDHEGISRDEIAEIIQEKIFEKYMPFDLCVGGKETFLVCRSPEDQEIIWDNLKNNYGWQEDWAAKRGNLHIVIHQEKMPISYRWKCAFVNKTA